MRRDNRADLLPEMYQRLHRRYGPQGWWPGDGPLDVVIGAILTQAAAWRNVELAIRALKEANCWSLLAIRDRPVGELAAIIRPSGYFNAKARKLQAFASHVLLNYQGDLPAFLDQELEPLRRELLAIHGIGQETADDILVYAAGKPSFVIDSYTRRIVDRMGLMPEASTPRYDTYQDLFHENLPLDVSLFNEYHALLDRHGMIACTKVPICAECCLQDICPTGQAA